MSLLKDAIVYKFNFIRGKFEIVYQCVISDRESVK
ncbi:MAG: hypothetical protein Hyperionvirus36_7 [Hyperionvirus sp.]|uniref:Uncharacterized protein n=1 Tax=Hyperionvirus sp. TaxID=2487770 RepID=A0A3G5AC00_9VIRU|nr:MAG: hypothetical protein Hyperionvirus36_7 [Hyperionvirus sp.]